MKTEPKKNKQQKDYRVIIRFSLNNDTASKVRNGAFTQLKNIGFVNTSTGIWQTDSCDLVEAQGFIGGLLEDLSKVSADESMPCILDHLWIYIDRA